MLGTFPPRTERGPETRVSMQARMTEHSALSRDDRVVTEIALVLVLDPRS